MTTVTDPDVLSDPRASVIFLVPGLGAAKGSAEDPLW
jgi:hypothetical protein